MKVIGFRFHHAKGKNVKMMRDNRDLGWSVYTILALVTAVIILHVENASLPFSL